MVANARDPFVDRTTKTVILNTQGTLQWRDDERDGVSNYRHLDCSFNRLFRRRSKKTSKLRATGPSEGNPPVTDGFPSQRPGDAEILMTSWWKYAISSTRKDFNCLRLPSVWKSWEMGMQIHVSQNKCMVINDWHKSPNVSFETDDHTLLTVMMFQSRFLYSWIDGLSGRLISGRCMLINLPCIILKYCRSLYSIMKMRHSDNKLMMRKQHCFHRHVPTSSCHIIHSRFVVVASRVRSCYFNIKTFCATYIHIFFS